MNIFDSDSALRGMYLVNKDEIIISYIYIYYNAMVIFQLTYVEPLIIDYLHYK